MGADFMMAGVEGKGSRCRGVILGGDTSRPDDLEVLYRGPWVNSEELALVATLVAYWPIYEKRQGFRHPEDPRGSPGAAVPPNTMVVCMAGVGAAHGNRSH